jgi:hypothetical protein
MAFVARPAIWRTKVAFYRFRYERAVSPFEHEIVLGDWTRFVKRERRPDRIFEILDFTPEPDSSGAQQVRCTWAGGGYAGSMLVSCDGNFCYAMMLGPLLGAPQGNSRDRTALGHWTDVRIVDSLTGKPVRAICGLWGAVSRGSRFEAIDDGSGHILMRCSATISVPLTAPGHRHITPSIGPESPPSITVAMAPDASGD